jgi:hypothetical protein
VLLSADPSTLRTVDSGTVDCRLSTVDLAPAGSSPGAPASTNRDRFPPPTPDDPVFRPAPFFGRALVLLAVVLAVGLGLGRAAGRAYRPKPLAPTAEEVAASERFVLILGNSVFEAGIDPARLAAQLSSPSQAARARMFTGGGWDALHYYMLALLAKDQLRPQRDAVVIEVSPSSLDDAQPGNRLGTLRPEVARELISLPGAPLETRLDVLCGAVAPLYRYRMSLHGVLAERWARAAAAAGPALGGAGLAGAAPRQPPFRLVTAPGRDFVIDRIEGDREAFLRVAAEQTAALAGRIEVGGFKRVALERAIAALRARDIPVVLVQTPSAPWHEQLMARGAAAGAYQALLERLRRDTGVTILARWPAPLREAGKFWDGNHMVAGATAAFTDALAAELRATLSW